MSEMVGFRTGYGIDNLDRGKVIAVNARYPRGTAAVLLLKMDHHARAALVREGVNPDTIEITTEELPEDIISVVWGGVR